MTDHFATLSIFSSRCCKYTYFRELSGFAKFHFVHIWTCEKDTDVDHKHHSARFKDVVRCLVYIY